MKTVKPEYNDTELDLIEKINAAFDKKELDPNIAIAQVIIREGRYIYSHANYEACKTEALLRGVTYNGLIKLEEEDNSYFYPAKHKPIPWWEITLQMVNNSVIHGDGFYWFSPYGSFYYLPFLLLGMIHEWGVDRQQSQDKRYFFNEFDWWRLDPGPEFKESDCWNEIDSVPNHYKDPLNKKDLYGMSQKDNFLSFISFLNETQKRVVSAFVRYGLPINFKPAFDDPPSQCTYLYTDEVSRMQACWKFI